VDAVAKIQRKRVTLGDVAAKAGVSVATASVAITGKPSGNCRVSPAVAEKIRRAARQLNYRPNIYARNLSTQRTQTVAILVKRANWHNAMYFLASAQRLLRERGYTEIFLMHRDNTPETERQNIGVCLDRRVEGILIMPLISLQGRTNAALLNEVQGEENIPVVQLTLALPECAAPAVVTDDIDGIGRAVAHLHAAGHRRIAHVTVQGHADATPLNPYRHAHLRYAGYTKAMAALGLGGRVVCPQGEPPRHVDAQFDDAVRVAHDLADAAPREPLPTAIVTYSDYEAAGLLAGFSEAGVRVPEQVSIVGFGDSPFSRMVRPALSTLAPAYEQMGEVATRTLLSMIDGEAGESAALPPTLLTRQSVAPPPGTG
jgi:LacI family transcriptional regulator